MSSYEPVSATDDEQLDVELPLGTFTIDDDFDDDDEQIIEGANGSATSAAINDDQQVMQPLEMGKNEEEEDEGFLYEVDSEPLFRWKDPWLPSVIVTLLLIVPVLLCFMWTIFNITGRLWVVTPFSLHLFVTLLSARLQLSTRRLQSSSLVSRVFTSLSSLLDLIVFGFVYSQVCTVLILEFFTEPDGTTVMEWSPQKRALQIYRGLGLFGIATLRFVMGSTAMAARMTTSRRCSRNQRPLQEQGQRTRVSRCPRILTTFVGSLDRLRWSWTEEGKAKFRRYLGGALSLLAVVSFALLVTCLYSLAVHWLDWPAPTLDHDEGCDPLDHTECWLPFPSFHFMQRDASTQTGWRVNLQGRLLPPLKGRIEMDPHFLNKLDGFSNMGSILFYLEGMKEAHEARIGPMKLQGPADIAKTLTSESITLLLDVNASLLVAHSAEIDYLDSENPLVMVFPAQPLQHNNHYALAVVNATDAKGNRLSSTAGLTAVLADSKSDRRVRYEDFVVPALEKAAPWVSVTKDPGSVQLLFDFVTASEESQLGPVRRVRDATLKYIKSSKWGDWKQHVRVNRILDNDCDSPYSLVARTVNAELDVPWFLDNYGPGHRGAFLSDDAVRTGQPTTVGAAKFVVHIPCSVRAAALGEEGPKPLRALMEYGHGLFFSRQEASDRFLLQLAHDEGYVITAMDWRGMSVYDLLIVVKTLLSTPRLFQAVRDNLIQGYANKFCLQHFMQNGMLSMNWFQFRSRDSPRNQTVPLLNGQPPVSTFYGISQGGILGAGYTALSGATGLIRRGALSVPGTPFSLIMTRSLDFAGYDALMLLNFYDNRHIRMLLALVQMGWDSVEGSGVLGTPVNEPIPPLLLQAGLGDPIVPTIAAEALARGLGASILPNNPRKIYGIPQAEAANETYQGPHVALTELLYEKEYAGLPVDDVYADGNSVHICLRRDAVMLRQLAEFLNTGRIVDPCLGNGCIRKESSC